MCIICNAGDDGDEFLGEFQMARDHMKRATEAMRKIAIKDRAYDKAHKRMVAVLRDWNRIEQEREEFHRMAENRAPHPEKPQQATDNKG